MQTKIFAVLALLLLSGVTYQRLQAPAPPQAIQQQEEVEAIIPVTYQAQNEEEERLLDLLWLQKAAQQAMENGETYFNIIEQKIGIESSDQEDLTYMEGLIEITHDRGAEYNAEEIIRVNIEEL